MTTKKNNSWVRNSNLLLSVAIAALFCAAGGMRPASAQSVTGSGVLTPGVGTIVSPDWVIGGGTGALNVGNTAPGTLDISGGGTVTNVNRLGFLDRLQR
jgi:fibronectin-binding autotransporter adhesin